MPHPYWKNMYVNIFDIPTRIFQFIVVNIHPVRPTVELEIQLNFGNIWPQYKYCVIYEQVLQQRPTCISAWNSNLVLVDFWIMNIIYCSEQSTVSEKYLPCFLLRMEMDPLSKMCSVWSIEWCASPRTK